MNIHIDVNPQDLGHNAARQAAAFIHQAIRDQEYANIILATGASQFTMLDHLVEIPDIDWTAVRMFHLDEYIGMPETHRASFRRYLQERFVDQVGMLDDIFFIQGDHPDPLEECRRLNGIISHHPIDVAMIGIGENGHLAFNDPPADFETEDPYIIVELDEDCRKQQLGEGWFKDLSEVPRKAISMSIRQILKSKHLIVSVPDHRKALAVKNAVKGHISPMCPASILRTHKSCDLYLDEQSASLL